LLEIAKYVSEEESKKYTQAAINILKACDEHFCNYEEDEDALVLMGTERYPLTTTKGLHIPIIYGDFFFAEAMCKLKGREFFIW
jgi:unsaturated chondroitin disaccharide hydrolase